MAFARNCPETKTEPLDTPVVLDGVGGLLSWIGAHGALRPPGLILRDTVLREDGGISVKEFAEKLGMTGMAISRVVNGKTAVSPELAIRLAALLNVTARSWLTMQAEYDLWQLRNKRRPKIRRLAA